MSLHAGERSWGSHTALKLVRDGIANAMGVDRKAHWEPRMTNDTLMGYWHDPEDSVFYPVEEPEDDIDYLMLHQDCAGILPRFAVPRVVARLKDIIVHIEDDSVWPTFSAKRQAIALVDFLEEAAEDGHMIVFSG